MSAVSWVYREAVLVIDSVVDLILVINRLIDILFIAAIIDSETWSTVPCTVLIIGLHEMILIWLVLLGKWTSGKCIWLVSIFPASTVHPSLRMTLKERLEIWVWLISSSSEITGGLRRQILIAEHIRIVREERLNLLLWNWLSRLSLPHLVIWILFDLQVDFCEVGQLTHFDEVRIVSAIDIESVHVDSDQCVVIKVLDSLTTI